MKNTVNTAFFQPISNELAEQILSNPIDSCELSPLLYQKAHDFERWHYSWLLELFQSMNDEKRHLFFSLLSQKQQKGISKQANVQINPSVSSSFIKQFYKYKLYPFLPENDVLPVEYLPKSIFNKLLKLQKDELIKLMDFLGIYDLASEVRRIVAKNLLRSIYACLDAEQQNFLKECLHAKDLIAVPPLRLETWDGTKKTLMQILHRRGMQRFSIALSGEHPDFIWHLAHILDTGRGQLLQKNTQSKKISTLTDAVRLQVENVLKIPNLFKKLDLPKASSE